MGSQDEHIELLRGLIERLGAPDLTLSEAKVLRDRLAHLLSHEDRRTGGEPRASSPLLIPPPGRGDETRPDTRSSRTSMRVAG